MERESVMLPSWVKEAVAYGGAMESSPSRSRSSSSGCQSGWTLYLDHSNGNGNGMRRYLPCDDDPAAAQRWMVLQDDDDDVEDSMASDASSGPPLELDQEQETRRNFEQRPQGYIGHYSASSGSGGFGGSSTWSSSQSQGGVRGHIGRRGVVVVHGGEATATRQYREIVVDEEEDELDDTASSSSAVFCNPVAMVHVNFSSCRMRKHHQRSSHELRNI